MAAPDRHQADVLHAHAILKRGGLRDDHMVVMAYDDLAGSYENPAPGKIINKPGEPGSILRCGPCVW